MPKMKKRIIHQMLRNLLEATEKKKNEYFSKFALSYFRCFHQNPSALSSWTLMARLGMAQLAIDHIFF